MEKTFSKQKNLDIALGNTEVTIILVKDCNLNSPYILSSSSLLDCQINDNEISIFFKKQSFFDRLGNVLFKKENKRSVTIKMNPDTLSQVFVKECETLSIVGEEQEEKRKEVVPTITVNSLFKECNIKNLCVRDIHIQIPNERNLKCFPTVNVEQVVGENLFVCGEKSKTVINSCAFSKNIEIRGCEIGCEVENSVIDCLHMLGNEAYLDGVDTSFNSVSMLSKFGTIFFEDSSIDSLFSRISSGSVDGTNLFGKKADCSFLGKDLGCFYLNRKSKFEKVFIKTSGVLTTKLDDIEIQKMTIDHLKGYSLPTHTFLNNACIDQLNIHTNLKDDFYYLSFVKSENISFYGIPKEVEVTRSRINNLNIVGGESPNDYLLLSKSALSPFDSERAKDCLKTSNVKNIYVKRATLSNTF